MMTNSVTPSSSRSFLDDFAAQCVASHDEEARAGLHDDECEWRANGHWLCHCAKRRRIASGLTTPPRLIVQYPLCSNCSQETSHNGDGLECRQCSVFWGSYDDDAEGEFFDDYGTLDPSPYDRRLPEDAPR